MIFLRKKFADSPILARVVPFAVFLLLTFCQGQFGEASRYWFYLAKTLVGVWLIWEMRRFVTEMRWAFSWEAVVVGVGVCVIWVGLDGWYPTVDQIIQNYLCPVLKSIGLESWCPKPSELHSWNPRTHFGESSALAWLFIFVRIIGSSLVVPPLEEVFYRSFLYRYIAKIDFLSVALKQFAWLPFLVTAAVFGFAHREWLAGILCAMGYQWLVIRKQRLGDAMTAHAITNFLLGAWVVWKQDWKFW
jgi:hypothetical protein